MAGEKLDTTNKIVIPGDGNLSSEETKKDIVKGLKDLMPEEIEMAAKKKELERKEKELERKEKELEKKEKELEKKEKELEKREKEKLYWNKDAILNDLEENHIKIYENEEVMWYKWRIVEITLPGVWEEFNPFKYFVSEKSINMIDFEKNPELAKKSYSMKDIWGLLKAMNEYMKAMGVRTDRYMDYENDLKDWQKGRKNRCDVWDCLKQIELIDGSCWLKDKDVPFMGARARWDCGDNKCCFHVYESGEANLLLRVS